MFTIRLIEGGYEIVDADGNVLATFVGETPQAAYAEAAMFLTSLLELAAPAEDDDGLLPERWTSPGPIAFHDALPGGRDFTSCDWSWRTPPLALMLQTENAPQHAGSQLAGFADKLWLDDDGLPWATGRFYANAAGEQARDFLKGDRTFGVSVDPSEDVAVEMDCGEWAEDELFGEYCVQEIARFTAYEIAGLTMVPFPGFENAQIKLGEPDQAAMASTPFADNQDEDDGDANDTETDSGDAADSSKLPQSVVNYDASGGTEGNQCEDCAHFQARSSDGDTPACQIVQDPIVAGGVCDVFVASAAEDENGDASDSDTAEDDSSKGGDDESMMTLDFDDGSPLATQEQRDKYGMPGTGAYPIWHCGTGDGSVDAAKRAVGRGNEDHDKIRRHIIAAAKKQGCSDQIPDDWQSDGSVKASKPKVAASAGRPLPRAAFEVEEPAIGVPFDTAFQQDVLGDDVLVPQYNVVRDALGRFKSWGTNVVGTAVPFTITDDRRVYGHLTFWGQCHVGNPWGPGKCASVSPSQNGYADFYGAGTTGPLDDGSELSCGVLHVGCEHSEAMDVRGVRDAAAHAGLAFAKVRVMDGQYGPWYCGVLLDTVTDDQIDALRALTLSGEWVPELGAVIAVNDGGLPMQRRDRIAASNGSVFVVANKISASKVVGGKLAKLIGGTSVRPCAECAKRARLARENKPPAAREVLDRLSALEAQYDRLILGVDTLLGRTAHMRELERADVLRRLGVDES